MLGYFAISAAGHDKGKIFIIIGRESDRTGAEQRTADEDKDDIVLIADGIIRKVEKPKKKKLKHLIILDVSPVCGAEKLSNRGIAEEIRKVKAVLENG